MRTKASDVQALIRLDTMANLYAEAEEAHDSGQRALATRLEDLADEEDTDWV